MRTRNWRLIIGLLIGAGIVFYVGVVADSAGAAYNPWAQRPTAEVLLDTDDNGLTDTIQVEGAIGVTKYDPLCGENLMKCYRSGAAGTVDIVGHVILGRSFGRDDFAFLTDKVRSGAVSEDQLIWNTIASREAAPLMGLDCSNFVMELGSNAFPEAYELTWLIEFQADDLCNERTNRFAVAKHMVAVARFLGTHYPSFSDKVNYLRNGWDVTAFEIIDTYTIDEDECFDYPELCYGI